ncbi:hypothetical protein L484_006613 [Morus notabilis]|uniref:Uncharacterized protein n=1 Tax=Morus notabilis TaxID=981085 RepID=W9RVF0_9ROSA|nr:hypothetical protein L484_006613 [Morus notabilis]
MGEISPRVEEVDLLRTTTKGRDLLCAVARFVLPIPCQSYNAEKERSCASDLVAPLRNNDGSLLGDGEVTRTLCDDNGPLLVAVSMTTLLRHCHCS